MTITDITHAKPCHCPNCGMDWSMDRPISIERLGWYGGTDGVPMDCEYGCGRPRHFEGGLMGRVWGDRVQEWSCLGCGTVWPRDGEGSLYAMRQKIKETASEPHPTS